MQHKEPLQSIRQIKLVLGDPSLDIHQMITRLGYESQNSELGDLLTAIIYMYPNEYSDVINKIFSFNEHVDNICEQTARQSRFMEDIRERDGTCQITGRFSARCQVAHIYPFSKCESIAKYDTDNGILIDSGLHQLWDNGYIQLVPIGPSSAQFIVNPLMCSVQSVERDIPELVEPVTLQCLNSRMIAYIQRRYESELLDK